MNFKNIIFEDKKVEDYISKNAVLPNSMVKVKHLSAYIYFLSSERPFPDGDPKVIYWVMAYPNKIVGFKEYAPSKWSYPILNLEKYATEDDKLYMQAIYEKRVCNTYLTINEPTIKYNIGQKINDGKSTIEDITEDGKWILTDVNGFDNNYGKKVPYNKKRICAWSEIIPYIENPIIVEKPRKELRFSRYNSGVQSLLTMYYHFGINMEPEYQRGYVWNDEQKESLIDSIFMGYEIGRFSFLKNLYGHNKPSYEIIDGKQRLKTIIDFYENRFTYKGHFYYQLSHLDQSAFENFGVEITEMPEESVTREQIIDYFIRINTHGTPVSNDHINSLKK